uniref:FUZ/MON1/HPS1 first Longin domain-containing protein n=1 Tax=Meloidogyne javanica TaxID=6303 RepID=A0A915MEK6_MELJA
MQYCNNNGSDDEDDQKCLATTTPFDGQVLILSESGKPIFYSKGDEDEICSFFGVISIIVQRYHSLGNEDGRDSLLSIQRRDLFFQFLYRSPLILCLVSRQPCNLHIQLDTIYNQIISMFSRKMLREYYQKRGSNFDIRSLFAKVVAFGLLIAHRQLVALVRFKRLNLDAPDFNTIVNIKWAEQLWHFIYKNTSNTQDPTQVCCSTPKKPFISYQELILLYNGYTKLADLLRKSGTCLAYKEWCREKKSGLSQEEEFKLVHGMLLSLRSFTHKLATKTGHLPLVHSYKTSSYKMNYMETATGLKMVLNADPDAVAIAELMQAIFAMFVETVLKNPFLDTSKQIDSELFHKRLDELVRSHYCFT